MNRTEYKFDPSKKVAICGFASSSLNQVPIGDESFEIWGLNSLYAFLPRWTRWFEIHPRDHIAKDLNRAELKQLGIEHVSWLKQWPGPGQTGPSGEPYRPIYMQDHYDDIPASTRWPRSEINAWTRAMFGAEAEIDYFTSTPGEMVVQAIYEGYGEIHLYGVDLLQSEEYAYQRPGCEYWLGIARGLGIKVVVPSTSALCKASYVYGYSEPAVEFGKLEPLSHFHAAKVEALKKQLQQITAEVNFLNGGRQAYCELLNNIEGKTLEQIHAFVASQQEQIAKRSDISMGICRKLEGGIEYATSSVAWTEHFGRGGVLEGHGAAGTAAMAASS